MHRLIRKALENAKGESQHVIAVMLDIRGFSKFSRTKDSFDVAAYIGKAYIRIIDDYFSDFGDLYFKTTGDGLLIVIPCAEEELQHHYTATIESSIKCHNEFASLVADEALINFEVPEFVGIGIARGSATALISTVDGEQLTIDYSGHKLNLAARLQDMARPHGIVLEATKDIDLLPIDVKDQFHLEKNVYIRSVAESKPTIVWALNDSVVIPSQNKSPFVGRWVTERFNTTKREIRDGGDYYSLDISNSISSNSNTQISINGAVDKSTGLLLIQPLELGNEYTIENERNSLEIVVNCPVILEEHESDRKSVV